LGTMTDGEDCKVTFEVTSSGIPNPLRDGSIPRNDGTTLGITFGSRLEHLADVTGNTAKDRSIVHDGTNWVMSTPALARAALGFGVGTGGTFGVSGDILIVNSAGTTLEYTTGYKGNNFVVSGLSCDAGATFGGDINVHNAVYIASGLRHIGDTNTKMIFEPSSIFMSASKLGAGNIFLRGTSSGIHFPLGISADAGATFGGAVNLVDNVLSRPELKDYSETVYAIGTVYANTLISFADGNVQTVTIGGDCGFSFTYPPATGKAGTLTIIMTNAGNYTTTWPSNVLWPGDNSPAGTSGGVDILSFMTIDAGTIIYGFVGGINFS